MYIGATKLEGDFSNKRAILFRARVYAEAALRDFQSYQGRTAQQEEDVQDLLQAISHNLAELT